MKKNILFIFGAIALLAAALTSCTKEEYDFPGDAYNRVYVKPSNANYAIVHTPVGSIVSVDFQLVARCNQAAKGDITVTFDFDNSLAERFNTANKTSYATIDPSMLTIKRRYTEVTVTPAETEDGNDVVTKEVIIEDTDDLTQVIKAGSYVACDTLIISVNPELAAELQEEGYVVPIVIKDCKGGEGRPSTNLTATNFNVITSHNLINASGTTDGLNLVADRSAWTATTSVANNYASSYPFSRAIDGSNSTYARFTSSSSNITTVTIDMAQTYNVKGLFGRCNNSSWSVYGLGYYWTNLQYSVDGDTWADMGAITSTSATSIIFYGAVPMRYIRMTALSNRSNPYIYEFNIYE